MGNKKNQIPMPGKEGGMPPGMMSGDLERDSTTDNNFNEEEDGADGDTENLLQPDKKISMNDFEPVTVIGRGSFGKVYLVKKKDSGLPYAMKILKKDQLIKKNLLIKTQGNLNLSIAILINFINYS